MFGVSEELYHEFFVELLHIRRFFSIWTRVLIHFCGLLFGGLLFSDFMSQIVTSSEVVTSSGVELGRFLSAAWAYGNMIFSYANDLSLKIDFRASKCENTDCTIKLLKIGFDTNLSWNNAAFSFLNFHRNKARLLILSSEHRGVVLGVVPIIKWITLCSIWCGTWCSSR